MRAVAALALLAWTNLIGSALAQTREVLTFEEAKRRADGGDAFAQAVVALHYQLGWNTEKNPELAAKYALASANAGEPLGQFRLGALMRAGEGVAKDEDQGLTYQAASFNGLNASQDPYSLTAAGIMIFQGKVVGQNVPQDQRRRHAAALYKKAADMSYAPAQFNYAMALNDGHGVIRDNVSATRYIAMATTENYPLAKQWQVANALNNSAGPDQPPSDFRKGTLQESSAIGPELRRAAETKTSDAGGGQARVVVQQKPTKINWVSFNKDGSAVAAVSDAAVYVYECATGRLIRKIPGSLLGLSSRQRVFWSEDPHELVCIVRDSDSAANALKSALRFFDIRTGVSRDVQISARGVLLAFDGSSNTALVLEEGDPHQPYSWPRILHDIDAVSGIIRTSSDIPGPPRGAMMDDEYYTALFDKAGDYELSSWTEYEGQYLGVLRYLKREGGVFRSVDGIEGERLLARWLGIQPQRIFSEQYREKGYEGPHYIVVKYEQSLIELGRSISLCDDHRFLVSTVPDLEWFPIDDVANVQQGKVASGSAAHVSGVSSSGDGSSLLLWGIGWRGRIFNELGRYGPDKDEQLFEDTPTPPAIVDLHGLVALALSIDTNNQVWNGAISDTGENAALLVSSIEIDKGDGMFSDAERAEYLANGGNVFVEPQILLFGVGDSITATRSFSASRIYPFTYATDQYVFPPKAVNTSVLAFSPANYALDFSRFTIDKASDAVLMSAASPPEESIGDNRGITGYITHTRSVQRPTDGRKVFWQVVSDTGHLGDDPISSHVYTSLGDSNTMSVAGKVVAAYPLENDLVAIAAEWGVAIWNPTSGEIIEKWTDPAGSSPEWWLDGAAFRNFALAPENNRIFFLSSDSGVNILNYSDVGRLSQIAKLYMNAHGSPTVVLPDNFYSARLGAVQGVHFAANGKTFPFEQFDLRLNRPDIVLERLGAPAEAVAIAREIREKRLKRMGVTEEMLKPDFHVPELEIVGDVPTTTDAGEINLAIKASDSKYPLERLKVYVNNVPVNGRDGELLRDENKADVGLLGRITGAFTEAPTGPQSLERTIPIKLAVGRNKIQVSVLNNAGAESLYANAEVNCAAKGPKPTLYAVAMGVSEYSNPDWNLKYAAKDAQDVMVRLKSKAGNSYGEVKELLLTDQEVTKESIAKIRKFLSGATINDTVLMFVAGHGLLDSKYDYYFGTTDIDFNNPADKGIAFEEFDDLLADLPSLKKSLLIDTCHAGELDEEEKTLLASAGGVSAPLPSGNGIAMRSIGTRGMNVKAVEGARGASEWYDRLQGLFVDLRRGSGSTILSSSAGAEYALESSEQQNGLFTYAVLEALDGKPDADTDKDGFIEMSELGEYVKKRVSELTNGKQTPNTRRVNLEGDFTLAKTK